MAYPVPTAEWTKRYTWLWYGWREPYPAPLDWVFHTRYIDELVWFRYPEIGEKVAADRDYVLNSDFDFDHPPYSEREGVAILRRCWPDDVEKWRATPWYELEINQNVVLTLQDRPSSEELQDDWWLAVAETLARFTRDESYETVVRDLDLQAISLLNSDEQQEETSPATL